MSSLDDVYNSMKALSVELDRFHALLAQSMNEMDRWHREADPLWQDAFRRQYDEQWLPLQDKVNGYRKRTAQQYERFLAEKLRALEKYLGIRP